MSNERCNQLPGGRAGRRSLRKRLNGLILTAIVLLLNLSLGSDGAFGQNESGYIDLVQRLEIDRFDLGGPAALTADSTAGPLFLLTQDHLLHAISSFSRLQGSAKMPASAELLTYDPRSHRMLVFDAQRQILIAIPWQKESPLSSAGMELPTAVPLSASGVTGLTLDPVSGDLYVLSSSSRQLERYATAGFDNQSPQMRRLTTAPLPSKQANLQGLAFDPTSRHLFSYDAHRSQLVEMTLGGRPIQTYDLSLFNLPQGLSLAFAPSSDQTDDPAATSLFVAGGSVDGDIWELTFTAPEAVPAAAAAVTLVQTIQTWQFTPPSPDAAGATYLPSSNRILETDSEVNEKPIYVDANQFEISLTGILQATNTTLAFSDEPTGVAYDPSRNHLFLTNDNDHKVDEVDLNYQFIQSFDVGTLDGKSVDAEGIAYNAIHDRLYIAGGVSNTIFWIDPGPDNDFGTADDFDGSFAAQGLSDPEGITFNTDNGNIYAAGKYDVVAEYTTTGNLVQTIDISAPNPHKPAGMAYSPSSTGGGSMSMWVTDRGVDADAGINGGLGDGRIYEFALGTVGTPPAPAADFSGTPTSGFNTLTVEFRNLTSGVFTTCSWDFGDSSTSTDCNDPSHTYTSEGTYTVSLTVTGPGGSNTKTETNYISVVIPVVANFNGAPTDIIAPDSVTFNNTSSGSYNTCSWDFGDGSSSSSCNAAVNHTYTVGGVYNVSLTVSGPGGTATKTLNSYITVHQAPAVAFSGSPVSGPAPLVVDFSNQATGDFASCAWDFDFDHPNSSTSGSCNVSVQHTYSTPGTYSVKLAVDGSWGSDELTKSNYITVYQPAAANFSADTTQGIAPHIVNFTNSSTGAYATCTWNFGDSSTSNSCNSTVSHTYTSGGIFTVSLTVSGNGGENTQTKNAYITIYEAPNVDFSGSPTSGPAPLTVNFNNLTTGDYDTCTWDFDFDNPGTKTSSACNPPAQIYDTPGIYAIKLAVGGPGGSGEMTKSGYISVYATPTADFSALPTSGPAPLNVQFTNLSGGVYDTCTWTFGDGGSSNSCIDPAHNYVNPGTYSVSLTINGSNGEATTSKVDYIVAAVPVTADFSSTPTGGNAPLHVNFLNLATGDYDTCLWEFGDSQTSSICADPQHTYVNPGLYPVSLTISGPGGSQQVSKPDYIMVSEAGNASFAANPTQGIAPLTVAFSNLSIGDYNICQWDFGDGVSSADCADPSHTYNTSGIYSVSLAIDGPGGPASATYTDLIHVYESVTADFSGTPLTGYGPHTVSFSNLSSGDFLNCSWDFGDGSTSSECNNLSHTYTASGNYSVALQVSGPGGSDTKLVTNYVTVNEPTVDFSATPLAGNAPLAVSFQNLSNGQFNTCLWKFGDGATSTACVDPGHTYTEIGAYTVELTMSGASGNKTTQKVNYINVGEEASHFMIYMGVIMSK